MSYMSHATIPEIKLDKELASAAKRLKFRHSFTSRVDFFSNKMQMFLLIRAGVPYSLFDVIQQYAPFSTDQWAGYLDVSVKTLHRYKQDSKSFKPIQSEKIIEMAEVTTIGLDVFGDMDKFKQWLETTNYALGNFTPMELLKDSYGKELVIGELTRINYGIFV